MFKWDLMFSKNSTYGCRKEWGRKRSWVISSYYLTFHLEVKVPNPKLPQRPLLHSFLACDSTQTGGSLPTFGTKLLPITQIQEVEVCSETSVTFPHATKRHMPEQCSFTCQKLDRRPCWKSSCIFSVLVENCWDITGIPNGGIVTVLPFLIKSQSAFKYLVYLVRGH
jgi:hypothetical protein